MAVLQSSTLLLQVDLAAGAKITSLRNRKTGREWLLQDPSSIAHRPSYGDTFVDAPLCGWDEMFPTVDACGYLGEDVELPDHGEVWSQRWHLVNQSETSLSCEIEGRALDYRLRRTIDVADAKVRFHYSLSTRREHGLSALWAPHPQFAVQPGTRLQLPAAVTRLASLVDGSAGPLQDVPLPDHSLDWQRVATAGTGVMLYADPDVRIDTAALVDADGNWLALHWDHSLVPYFAVWVDNGRYARSPVVCPEPMTGYFDSLQAAQIRRRVLQVAPDRPIEWTLTVEVGQAVEMRGEQR